MTGSIKLNEAQIAYLAEKLGISQEDFTTTKLKDCYRKVDPSFPPDLPRGGNKRKKK